ncbi:MAG: hypothetical protein Q8O43_01865 [Dehalococcoidia bacterium]|nr:hypothetical protein [Dehalococcoidia bacterium]
MKRLINMGFMICHSLILPCHSVPRIEYGFTVNGADFDTESRKPQPVITGIQYWIPAAVYPVP